MKSCALYLRVSTEGQREKNTIDSQKTILPKVAAAHHLEIYKTYVDDGISGESIEARPAFRQLLDDASAGYFQAVVVIDFDRLTRATDLTQLALIKKIFKDAGIKVITPNQVFDFSNEDHDFLSDLFGILSKHEKRKILSRTKRGIKEKRRQGKWISGTPPIPYYRDGDGRMLIDEEKKVLVLSLLEAGKQSGVMALSQEYPIYRGLLTRMFSRRRLLFYAGFLEAEGEKVPGEWPALISEEEAETILEKKEARRLFKEHKTPKFLLTGMGIFFCGACGHTVGSHSDSAMRKKQGTKEVRKYYRGYYQCNNRSCSVRSKITPSEEINGILLRRLDRQLKRIETIRGFIEKATEKPTRSPLLSLEQQLQKAERQKANLIRAIQEGVLGHEEARKALEAVREKISELTATKAGLEAKSYADVTDLNRYKEIDLQELGFADQRIMVQTCIEKVILHQKNLFIFYRFPINQRGNKERVTRPVRLRVI